MVSVFLILYTYFWSLKLDISGNTLHNWIYEKFVNNTNIEKLVMRGIQDYISLNDAMLNDFSKLDFLDMTDNKFLCNEKVADFYELAEKVRMLSYAHKISSFFL